MFRSSIRRMPVLLVPLALACTAAEDTATPVEGPNLVVVQATDYAFAMPDTLPAGLTTFQMNTVAGPELHHLTLIRLGEGHTMAEVQALGQSPTPPDWVTLVGGPNAPVPGGQVSVTLDLAPGTYVALCAIPSPDGVPHMAKGMMKEFTVVASETVRVLPAADLTVTMADYGWQWSAPPTAGSHLVKVVNAGPQWHEFLLVHLAPGKTAEDFLAWLGSQEGPPPGAAMGGVTATTAWQDQYVALDLVPGDYALICFLPDAADGREHFHHGMVSQFTVSQ